MSNLPTDYAPAKKGDKADPKAPENPATKKRHPVLWVVIAAVVVAIVGIAYYSHRAPARGPGGAGRPGGARRTGGGGGGWGMMGPTPVVAKTAVKGNIHVILNALGTVTPLATVTIHTQINGILTQVNFTEGQMVKKGDVLAVIDQRPYQAALEQAQGTLQQAQAQLKEAQIDLDRYVTLSGQDSISKQQVDAQRALVLQYQGMVKTDQAQVDSATVNLNYCTITAPVSGRIGLRLVDQGNYVTPGDATGIALLTQITPITVIYSLAEDFIPQVQRRMREVQKAANDKIVVEAYDRSGTHRLATGTLETIDNTVDTTTGQFKLRATFANDDEALFPNQFVNIKMFLTVDKGVTVIPTSAIERGQQGTYVYVIKEADDDDDGAGAPKAAPAAAAAPAAGGRSWGSGGGGGGWGGAGGAGAGGSGATVTARNVVLGDIEGENVGVISGVSPGDRVVIDGADRLKDGMAVLVQVPHANPTDDDASRPANAPANKGSHKRTGAPGSN